MKSEHFEARCDILIRDSKTTSPKNINYEPTVFIGTHNIGKEHKIELAFVGHVLGKIEGQVLQKGTIINVSGKKHGVNLKPLLKSLPKIASPLQEWLSFPASHPPPIILNKHCFYCPFQKSCKAQAEETDNLSQLSGMNVRMINNMKKRGYLLLNSYRI